MSDRVVSSPTATSTGKPAVEPPPLRRDRTVLGWALGEAVSSIGDQIWLVALAYAAVQLGSPALAGVVLASIALPRAGLMLLGGVVTDRFEARELMLWSNVLRVLILLGALVAYESWGVSAALLITVGVLFGVADAFYRPASQALPRQLVRKEELSRLAGIRQLLIRIAMLVGAPVGGLVMTLFGLRGAIIADGVSFAVIAVVLVQVRPRWARERAHGGSLWADMRAGFGYLARTPHVRSLVIALSGLNVFVSPVVVVGVALRADQEGWNAAGLGLLTGAIGAGAGLGTLLAIVWPQRRPVLAALFLLAAQAVALALAGAGGYAMTLVLMVVVGLTAGLASPMLAGAFQSTVGESYLGRTSAVVSITDSALAPLTLTAFGLLAAQLGVSVTIAAYGLAFLLLILFLGTQREARDVRLTGARE
ncbi:MFS transporter [Micromonospora sp. 15K316]|uniref:MFS transporter n=1 Tax=Micromonospora sp. 15K316 TaxID=2530376 RepID=UPI001404823E|nr:MFS transporter [Micromonospora sp. 15K316]